MTEKLFANQYLHTHQAPFPFKVFDRLVYAATIGCSAVLFTALPMAQALAADPIDYDGEIDFQHIVDNGGITQDVTMGNTMLSTGTITSACVIDGHGYSLIFSGEKATGTANYNDWFVVNTAGADDVVTIKNLTITNVYGRGYGENFVLTNGNLVLDNVSLIDSKIDWSIVTDAASTGTDHRIEIRNSRFENINLIEGTYGGNSLASPVIESKGDLIVDGLVFQKVQLYGLPFISVTASGGQYLLKDVTYSQAYNVNSLLYSDGYGSGGSVYIYGSGDTASTVTIQDSTFMNSLSGKAGAIMVSSTGGLVTLNVIADEKNVVFFANRAADVWNNCELRANDIIMTGNTEMNLNASESKSISIASGVETTGQTININKADITYNYNYYDGTKITLTNAVNTGAVNLYAKVADANVHMYGGTLGLYVYGSSTADPEIVQTLDYLSTSDLTIEGESRLKTNSVSPITKAAKDIATEVELLTNMTAAKFSTITLGKSLTLNANLQIQPTVNLETAQSDKYGVGDGNATVAGSGKLMVTGWIVKADQNSPVSVTVDLAAEGESSLKPYFGLADSAKVAYGPTYVWSVTHDNGSSLYTFVQGYVEPILEDEGVKDGIETEIKEEIKDLEEQSKSVDADSAEAQAIQEKIAELNAILDNVDQRQGTHMTDTPLNYNPDIYGEQVAVLGVSVIQNAISASVFSEMRIGQLGSLLASEKPERQAWWGKVSGADLDLKTKNFYKVDVDYALAMIGHQFTPIQTDFGNFEFGAYVGAVTANEKYSISKVKQNGGLIGGSVIYEKGNAWFGAHANLGIMSNHLKGITDNKTTNPWFGLGVSTGYNFIVPRVELSVAPFVDLSYIAIKAKDYTTNLGAEVKSSSLHSFEVSPGLSIDKTFGQGWGIHGQARYAIVSKHDGKSEVTYNDQYASLPYIANKNYVEYGAAVLKHGKNWGFAMNVNRSDGGRSGWSGMARLSYRF